MYFGAAFSRNSPANENRDARLRLNAQMRQRMAGRVDFPERLFLSFFSPLPFFSGRI
jgi:hypothetical protein